jgi:hypothetical protein
VEYQPSALVTHHKDDKELTPCFENVDV